MELFGVVLHLEVFKYQVMDNNSLLKDRQTIGGDIQNWYSFLSLDCFKLSQAKVKYKKLDFEEISYEKVEEVKEFYSSFRN